MRIYLKNDKESFVRIYMFKNFKKLLTKEIENNQCQPKQLKDFFFIEYDEDERQYIRFTADTPPQVYHMVLELIKDFIIP